MSACVPLFPANGLSVGIEPSGLMRTTFPRLLPDSCAGSKRIRSPDVMNSFPSGAKTRRPPKWPRPIVLGTCRQMTFTSRSCAPSRRPRATAPPFSTLSSLSK
jgi:hypothetical protein